MLYTIRYTGPFGFIKPWSAVRDDLTYSQTFLSPSTVKGLSQKLFGNGEEARIQRYRLGFDVIDEQQEQTWAPLRKISRSRGKVAQINNGIITRGVLINPRLTLALGTEDDATHALKQHICLSRNEDILLPDRAYGASGIAPVDEATFDSIPGFELVPSDEAADIPAGRDRFAEGAPMTFGKLLIVEAE